MSILYKTEISAMINCFISLTRLAVFANYLEMFPWLYQLEANWETIRDELFSFVKNGTGMCNVHTTEPAETSSIKKANGS